MKNGRINLLYRVLVASYALSTFSEGIILPVYAIFVQKIGGDILNAGEAMGIFLITEGVFTILVHRVRWGSRQRIFLMALGWFIWVLGISSYLLISSIYMLFITQILTAMGNAIADPIFEEELAGHTDRAAEEFEWGIFEGSKDIVSGVAAIAGGAILAVYDFKALIFLMIATATVSFFTILYYVLWVLRAPRREAASRIP